MAFPERDFEITAISSNVEVFKRPVFLKAGANLVEHAVGGREDLSLLLRDGDQSFILVDYNQLSELKPIPETKRSADLVTSALIRGTSVVFLTGAMQSGKSEVFNWIVTRIVYKNLSAGFSPPPVVVGRATKSRGHDSIRELQNQLSSTNTNFNLEIEGPLDFLEFVNHCLSNIEGGIQLAALEEAGVLLFSRPEYLSRVRKNPERAFERAGVPEEFREVFLQNLKDESQQDFGREVALVTQVLEKKGIKLLLVGLDRFTSGHPWEPMVQLSNLARETAGQVLIHRQFSECMGCGEPAVISTVTQEHYWRVRIGERFYRLYPFMHDLSGLVEAVEPYYAPLCERCNDLVRPEIASADWPVIEWPVSSKVV